MTLSEFVHFLNVNDMVDTSKIHDDDDDGFSNRLRIQKYIFLSHYFGLDTLYTFNMHIHGPYSKDLSRDYYSITSFDDSNPDALNSLNKDAFLNLLRDKSDGWLEVAATLLHKKNTINSDLIDHVAWIKCDFSREFIANVYSDLQNTILQ